MGLSSKVGSVFRAKTWRGVGSTLGSKLNFFGRIGEDFAHGAGVRTRGAREIKVPAKPATFGGTGEMDPFGHYDWHETSPAVPAVLGDRMLTGGGLAANIAGNVVGVGAIGTLGYKMFGGKDENGATQSHDANGVANPQHDEERAKFISKFQQDYLGGSKTMGQAKYGMMAKNSQWVKTAIDNMGMENYNKLREGLISGRIKPHDAHNAFTNALAESGDEEALKQAATEPYVLPGIARNKDGNARFLVIAPQKQKNGQINHTHLSLKIDEIPDEEPQQ